MAYPAPPLGQIPLGPGEFLAIDGFEIGPLAALVNAHRDRVRVASSYVDNFGGFPSLQQALGGSGVVLMSYTIFGNPANCADVESEAMDDSSALRWFRNGSFRPLGGKACVYKSAGSMQSLRDELVGNGIDAWYQTAHYGAGAHLCGPRTCGYINFVADSTQCFDAGPNGENVDVSVCRPGFLGVGSSAPKPPPPEDYMAVTAAELNGVPHVFVEAKDGSVWYTFQQQRPNWDGGVPGKQIAGLSPFCPAPGK